MSLIQKIFQWPKNVPQPRDAREILTPVDESDEKVVSDVIPTQCITSSYPVIDTTTYGDLTMGNVMKADGAAQEFSSYVLRHMEPDSRRLYTRCWFSRNITPTNPPTPVGTVKTWIGDHLWYRILLKVDLVQDNTFTRSTKGPGGIEIYAPRYYPRIYEIPEATEGTLFQEYTYVNSSIPTIGLANAPQPGSVNFSILGVSLSYERCLHGQLVFDSKQSAIVGYNAATSTVVTSIGSIAGQFFPETNYDEWVRYRVATSKPELVANSLWVHREIWANPPVPSEVQISTG